MANGDVTPVDVGVSDAELFDAAAADTPVEAEAEAEQPVQAEQDRDDKGRFVAKPDEPEAKAETVDEPAKAVTDEDKAGHVPSWRVREINAEKAELAKSLEAEKAERSRIVQQFEAMQREMQTLRKPAEQPKQPQRPDPLIDPEGYDQWIERRVEDRLLNERREISFRSAHREHKDAFAEAYTAAQQALAQGDPALAARLQQSHDPGEALMDWHRQRKIMAEVGNDPNVFFQKRLDAYLNDPANLAKVMERARDVATQNSNSQQRPLVKMPPTLSNMSPSAGARGDENDGDLSDEALFENALR